MAEIQISKQYDLEKRTKKFALDCRFFIKKIPKILNNIEDAKQLNRSSGSTGANYIEANEALSKKDFAMRIRICRKEAKESIYWLELIDIGKDQLLKDEQSVLIQEATELMKIFSAIMRKSL